MDVPPDEPEFWRVTRRPNWDPNRPPPAPRYPDEEWRRVPFSPGYWISNYGQCVSPSGPVGKPGPSGYSVVQVRDAHGARRWTHVHRLVLGAFVGPLPPGQHTRHLNGDPTDNRLVNLAYGTRVENCADRIRHGTSGWKLHAADVWAIRRGHALGVGDYAFLGFWYGIGSAHARTIVQRKKWRHVPSPPAYWTDPVF